MSGRILKTAIELVIAAQFAAAVAQGGDYRGAATGWPAYTNGTYAAGYPANYGVGPTYYVARRDDRRICRRICDAADGRAICAGEPYSNPTY